MSYGILLAPNQDTWNVVQGMTQGTIDFQTMTRNSREFANAVASGAINIPRSQVAVVFDNTSRLPASQDGNTSRLAYEIRNLIAPAEPGRAPMPVVVARSTQGDNTLAETLLNEIRHAFAADGEDPTPVNTITVCDATATNVRNAITAATGTLLPNADISLARTAAPTIKENRPASVVTFCGSKGGIGRTTLSHAFAFTAAYSAHQAGYELGVVVIEWDLQRSKVAHIVTFDNDHTPSLLDYRAENGRNEESLIPNLATASCVNPYGTRVLPKGALRFLLGPDDPYQASSIAPSEIHDIVKVLATVPTVDLIVIDCAPEVINNLHVTEAVKAADTTFLVADTDPQSLTDVDGSVEWLVNNADIDPHSDNFHLLINRCSNDIQDTWFLTTIAQSTTTAPTACIPRSPSIDAAVTESRSKDRFLRVLEDPRGRRRRRIATVFTVLQGLVAQTVPRPTRMAGESQ